MIHVYHLDTNHPAVLALSEGSLWSALHSDRIRLAARILWRKGAYKFVAEVPAKDLEKAFEMTQNGAPDQPVWCENPAFTPWSIDGKKPHRSTSVGDLMFNPDNEDRSYVVAPMGFEEVYI